MTTPSPLPTYVYKILDAPPAEPLPAELPVSDLDANDGFVHLSVAAQVTNPLTPFILSLPPYLPVALSPFTPPPPGPRREVPPREREIKTRRSPTRQTSSSTPTAPSGSSR
ncbi:hypothetical protein IMZ48_40970 [Candidatus Bathyarchaeota archaeon]|nr:hypothetical protein [Candidatus Bathyarchaeota archaeon]